MKKSLALALAIALAAGALLALASLAASTTNAPGCGNCLYTLGATASSLTGCDADSGCTVQEAPPPGSSEFQDQGTATGIQINQPGSNPPARVVSDHFSATFWQTVSSGLVSGAGEFTMTDSGGTVQIHVPITVSGTPTHLIYDSSAGGTFHMHRQSQGTTQTGSGVGFFTFSTAIRDAVSKALFGSATSISSSTNPTLAGLQFRLSATQCATNGTSAAPSGAIVFTDLTQGSEIGEANLKSTTGQKCSTAGFGVIPAAGAVGDHQVSAHYVPGGATPYQGTPDATMTLHVVIDQTQTTATSDANPQVTGQPTTLRYSVCDTSGNNYVPTGHVHITDNGSTDLGDGSFFTKSGNCTFGNDPLALGAGTHVLSVVYVPHIPGFAASSATYTQTVGDAVAITVINGPSAYHDAEGPVPIKAQICDTTNPSTSPTGTLHFVDQQTPTDLGTVTAGSGSSSGFSNTSPSCLYGSVDGSFLGPGAHTVRATYSPDPGFVGMTGTTSFSLSDATTVTLASSGSPSFDPGQVTFTATVCDIDFSAVPPGSVEIYETNHIFDQTVTLSPTTASCATGSYTTSALHANPNPYFIRARYLPSSPYFEGYPTTGEGGVSQSVLSQGG